MSSKRSAGIVLYRLSGGEPEVLLVHPGGPFWTNKDEGAWSIPKGEYDDAEDPQACAPREFHEETGTELAPGGLPALGSVKQRGGKHVTAWAGGGDPDAAPIKSNTFEMEWPPRSGDRQSFPEVYRAGWFALDTARHKMNQAQSAFIDRLEQL